MMRKKRNGLLGAVFNSKTLAVLGFFIIIAVSFPISKNISKKYKIDREILELEKEIETLEAANTDFKKMISYLESDSFVEEQARLNLGLKKEGEEVVVVESIEGEINKTDQKEDLISGFGGNKNFFPYVWWNYFFGGKK